MRRRLKPFHPLEGAQAAASDPLVHAALSASAGTGKTHVLTARVLRLLLSGVDPASILCLTFTKAGAAEMAERIHGRLAYWVRLREDDLARELSMLGEKPESAYFVKCDRSTMTQNDLDNGRLVCLVGVAALRPAEYVIIRIGQWTADRKV